MTEQDEARDWVEEVYEKPDKWVFTRVDMEEAFKAGFKTGFQKSQETVKVCKCKHKTKYAFDQM